MNPLTIDDARALLPAFALDALDGAEQEAMLDALQRFPELHAELDTFVKTVHTLGTTETVAPAPICGSVSCTVWPTTTWTQCRQHPHRLRVLHQPVCGNRRRCIRNGVVSFRSSP